jgi:hypothetical protein
MSMTSCCAAKLMSNVVHVEVEGGTAHRGDIVATDIDPAAEIESAPTTEADSSEKGSENAVSTGTMSEKAKTSQLGCCCMAGDPLPSEGRTTVIAQNSGCCTQGSGDNIESIKADQNKCGINKDNLPLLDEGCGIESLQGNSY